MTAHRLGVQPQHMGMHVRWSASMSCGHRLNPAETVPMWEANGPGDVVICTVCDEYAIVTRVTQRLVIDRDTAATMFAVGAQVDEDTAAALAADQFPPEDP